MSALGFMLIGFGILTAWSGFLTLNVFVVLRGILTSNPAQGKVDAAKARAKGP